MSEFSKALTVRSLIERIDFGDDIQFFVKGRLYTILGWYEGGPLVCDVTEPGKDEGQQFKDGADLVARYLIDGKPLADYINPMEMH